MSPTDDASEPAKPGPTDAPFEPVSTRRALRSIGRDLFSPPPRAGASGSLSSKATKEIVFGLDRRERTFGIILTLLNLYVVIVHAHQLHTAATTSIRNESTPFLVIGLAVSAMGALAIAIKRRALLGFCSVLAGLVFLQYQAPSEFLISAAFGVWLILRAQKYQKLQRATAPRATPSRAAKQPKRAAPAPRNPAASKRYTPPRRTRSQGRR